jgi:hypothetical protein
MALRDELKRKKEQIIKIAAMHGARNIRVFGSVARGEADEKSDIDFLVEMEPGRSLLDLGGLLMDLQEVLGRDVDVVTERGLNPRIRDRVLKEAVAL